jgi:iron complex outermembrane receptor protein
MTQKSNELAKAVRLALALSAGAGAAFATQPVHAQDEAKAEKLETIEVVGSRIKRTDVETSQPVFVLERQDLQRTGLTSIGDILQHIATNGATLNTTFNNGGTGETRINLRDLGSQRTLVLVNGRRWVTGASLAGVGGSVDLNTIPVSIVERVEVLKDGASSIYGSDAIAGVVNITTRQTYDGAEASGYLGENEEGDGRIESYDFTIGANSEKANVVVNLSYVKQEPIFAGDREISATPTANIPGNNSNVNASSSTPFGRFFIDGVPGSLTFDPTTGGYKPYNGNVDGFNFAPDNYLQTPQERTALYVQARYNLTDSITFRTEALYNQRRSALQLAASPLTLGAAFGIPIAIEPGQEFNPFTGVLNRVQYRPTNEFPRLFASDVDTFHFGGGFEGQFGLFDRNWSWDANYSYSLNETNNVTNGLVNIPNLIAGCSPTATPPTAASRSTSSADQRVHAADGGRDPVRGARPARVGAVELQRQHHRRPVRAAGRPPGHGRRLRVPAPAGLRLARRADLLGRLVRQHPPADVRRLRAERVLRRVQRAAPQGPGVRRAARAQPGGALLRLLELRQHHEPEGGLPLETLFRPARSRQLVQGLPGAEHLGAVRREWRQLPRDRRSRAAPRASAT